MNILLIIILSILVLLIIFFAFYGGFKKIKCKIVEEGEETLVYKEMIGDYAKSGKLSDEVYNTLLNEYKIETYKGFGIYYDNPKQVEKSKLRSEIGCIIEEKDLSKITHLKGELKTKVYPKRSYILSEFPFKGKSSIFIGLMKVYPAMEKFIIKNALNKEGAAMEIYDVPNKMIRYRKEI